MVPKGYQAIWVFGSFEDGGVTRTLSGWHGSWGQLSFDFACHSPLRRFPGIMLPRSLVASDIDIHRVYIRQRLACIFLPFVMPVMLLIAFIIA